MCGAFLEERVTQGLEAQEDSEATAVRQAAALAYLGEPTPILIC